MTDRSSDILYVTEDDHSNRLSIDQFHPRGEMFHLEVTSVPLQHDHLRPRLQQELTGI